MIRGLIASGLCVAVQVGGLCAPLVHAHLDDHHSHHQHGHRVHAHFGGHEVDDYHARPGSGAVLEEDDAEQVTRLQVFVAVHAAAFTPPALPQARFLLPASFDSTMHRRADVVRSHSPPDSSRSGSRAPPAFPS